MWLTFAGGIADRCSARLCRSRGRRRTLDAGGPRRRALAAGLGIALVFPGIFLNATRDRATGTARRALARNRDADPSRSSRGWSGRPPRRARGRAGSTSASRWCCSAWSPSTRSCAAFNQFGDLDTGAWLALAGGILAAGGTWAARGIEMPQAAPLRPSGLVSGRLFGAAHSRRTLGGGALARPEAVERALDLDRPDEVADERQEHPETGLAAHGRLLTLAGVELPTSEGATKIITIPMTTAITSQRTADPAADPRPSSCFTSRRSCSTQTRP